MSELNMPWAPRSRQKMGDLTEQQIAKKRGARPHPRSGAGSIKDDASTEHVQYEIKDANKTYTLKGSELDTLLRRANAIGKDAEFVVYFQSVDITVSMSLQRGKQ